MKFYPSYLSQHFAFFETLTILNGYMETWDTTNNFLIQDTAEA